MNLTTRLVLGRVLRQEARLVLVTMSQGEQLSLIEQLPLDQRSGTPHRHLLDAEADHLVELGLAVRTTYGVDLTMLGRVAAQVAYEARATAPGLNAYRRLKPKE